ncbi:antitoxin VapB family protein [Halogeometricum luteum]|uniref:Antitoxin VapB family protein n=1 Tax=Halogeometricum luteum TaxID=2950537 RepID=A0ABU2G475_9EURY|nr:antitoxin VapB family protein [Halogeometricum sp. S3BR5-2]MDS0295597.1 antitoxin VapB family protein [Halogeometricum sp. S3BR5-2]
MGTKSVRLDDDVYDYIEAHKRDDETFSDAVARLTRRSSITDLAGLLNSEDVETMRDAIDEADEADAEEVREVRERLRDS